MNYSEILLHGWLEACNLYGLSNMANQREAILEGKPLAHLKAYFNKNAKQAEAEGIPRDVFFNACRATLVKIADEIRNVYFRDKLDLSFSKDAMLNGRIKATKEQIAGIERQLQSMNVYQFGISLFQYSKGRYTGQLYMKEVEMIGLALDEAEKIDLVQQPKPKAEPKKLDTPEAALLLYALQGAYKAEFLYTTNKEEIKKQAEKLNEIWGFSNSPKGLRNKLIDLRKGTTNEKRARAIELLKQAGKYPKAIELLQKEMRSASEENALQNEV